MTLQLAKDILFRIVGLFLTSALGIITGAALIAPDVKIWESAVLAGFSAVAGVIQKLGTAILDGKITAEELDQAFNVSRSKEDKS